MTNDPYRDDDRAGRLAAEAKVVELQRMLDTFTPERRAARKVVIRRVTTVALLLVLVTGGVRGLMRLERWYRALPPDPPSKDHYDIVTCKTSDFCPTSDGYAAVLLDMPDTGCNGARPSNGKGPFATVEAAEQYVQSKNGVVDKEPLK